MNSLVASRLGSQDSYTGVLKRIDNVAFISFSISASSVEKYKDSETIIHSTHTQKVQMRSHHRLGAEIIP